MVFLQEIDGPGRVPFRPTKTSLPAAHKKQGGGYLIGKLFGRQLDSKSVDMVSMEEDTEEMYDPETLLGTIRPCPFIKPLEHRLQPRIEPIRSRRQPSNTSSDVVVSPITRARKRGETNAILTGRISDEDMEIAVEDEDPDTLAISDVMQIEYISVMASHQPDGIEDWKYYLECYAKGQFSLTNPPSPPQSSSNFRFLPAVYPPNETERMSLCSRYDILWPQWTQEKTGNIMRKAMTSFGTRFASLSFFDKKFELVKVENGYNRSQIDRDMSITAHVLLSSDVMVIVDTKKDWRFENHPLVTHRPKIRFFAGAPLLSAEGEVMGVLAVFEKEPRAAFSAQQRSELADFSRQIMTDLDYQADGLSDPGLRLTPLLERDSVINGEYRPRNIKSPVMAFNGSHVGSGLIPPGLHYHKTSNPSKQTSRLCTNSHSQNNFAHQAEPTPPSSAVSNHNSFFDKSESFGKNHEQLSEDPFLSLTSSLQPQTTLDCQHLRVSTPRPFSASDITSLNPHPPNTPERFFDDEELSHQPRFDLTVENFLSLSDTDCAEHCRDEQVDGDVVVRRCSISQPEEAIQRPPLLEGILFDDIAAGDRLVASGGNLNISNTPVKDSFTGNYIPRAMSRPLIDLSSPLREPDISMALGPYASSPVEDQTNRMSASSFNSCQPRSARKKSTDAAYACSMIAQELDYDLVYCVQLEPSLPFMTDQELYTENGLRKTILAAYGLSQPMDLGSALHVRALRSRGYHYGNYQDHYEDGEYESGCMVAIHSEGGPLLRRSSGIVMGAFRKPRPDGKREIRDTKDDLKRLAEFGKSLRRILLNKKPRQTMGSHTDQVPASSYPASEDVEVTCSDTHSRNYSFKNRHTNAFLANEATEVTIGNSRTRNSYSNSRRRQ